MDRVFLDAPQKVRNLRGIRIRSQPTHQSAGLLSVVGQVFLPPPGVGVRTFQGRRGGQSGGCVAHLGKDSSTRGLSAADAQTPPSFPRSAWERIPDAPRPEPRDGSENDNRARNHHA